ncbi:MAG: hypothetical protein M1531_09485, partial [Chloroflexi bacterium]|nr:hypothetical protein [Chloroflexota bacterium]
NLAIDPRLPGGSYRWTVALRPGSDAALATGAVELGRVTMAPRPALQPTSQPQHTMDTGFGDLVRLSGYSLSDERASPGGTLGLTLYWTPLNDIGEGYSMFVHVVDAGGKLVAQRDSVPCDGKCPTTSWVPGDTIEDHYEISLPKELPPGQYQIVVGLYLPVSGQRLPVAGAGEDSVTLPKHLTVK